MALHEDLIRQYELIETHISWVFLSETEVFKVKKPVNLGFLDFSDIDKRYRACVDEVDLNRRLAPSVYYGVVPVTQDEGGEHEIAGRGTTVDWAVHMRRLPDADRLDIRLAESRLSEGQLNLVVSRLAAFHDDIGPSELSEVFGGTQSIQQNVEENFEQTQDLLPKYLDTEQIEELTSWTRDFLSRRGEDLTSRSKEGRVREGHGDLRLEHIYLQDDGTMDVLDCIEFNQRFRIADVCADIVFLAMDLSKHGRSDLAEQLLATYARESNDFDIYTSADFYESYRAFVRGKISAFIANSGHLDTSAQEQVEQDARRHFLLALASERRSALPPCLVAVGGIIASGKSTVATAIAAAMSGPVVNADRTRKHLAGIEASHAVDAAAFDGMYSLAFTDKTYREVMRRAEVVLRSGRSVVLDASFRPRWSRELAKEVAEVCAVPFFFVECKVDEETCLARLEERERDRGVSDGRAEIFHDFVKRWEPVNELPPEQHIVLDTSLPLEQNMARLRELIPVWPENLTG
jgi:aminoglycoside phosphotransferase family enzyme/predicted kinase